MQKTVNFILITIASVTITTHLFGQNTNVNLGYYAGYMNTGTTSVFAGEQAGASSGAGIKNANLGYKSGASSTGSYNTILGADNYSIIGSSGVLIGYGNFGKNITNQLYIGYGGVPLILGNFTTGNVGIGVSPSYKLQVAGDIYASSGWFRVAGQSGLYSQSYGTYFQAIDANYWRIKSDRGLQFYNKAGTKQMGMVYHDGVSAFGLLDGDGTWSIKMTKDTDTRFLINNSEKMLLNTNGQLLIGTSVTTINTAFKLAVAGKILAQEIQVAIAGTSPWPDYVFATDYNLRPLAELEQFVNENQHLPEVPTAKEVKENGVGLGEMNAILLQKIEELTLYMIAQQKEIDALKAEVNKTVDK
ncbi:MAG: hypothetical protein WCX31_02250 [Salinivirgaceae bacterium]|jgi:hypothetical protein